MTLASDFQAKAERPWDKSYPANLKWDAEIPVTTMVKMFEETVAKNGDKTALNFMGRKMSYKEFDEATNRFAKGLQDQGLGKGSKVGLCLPNTPFYAIAYYGAMKAGATVVNFNPLYAENEFRHQIEDSKCDVMVSLNAKLIQPKIDKMLDGSTHLKKAIVCDLADALPPVKGFAFRALNLYKNWFTKKGGDTVKVANDATHIPFSKLLKSKGAPAKVEVSPDDVAVLQYTGGTTGVPKAAALSHANLTSNIVQSEMWFAAGEKAANDNTPKKDAKMLVVLPFFHVFSMTVQMNLSFKLGAELIMLPKFDGDEVLKVIDKEKPTMFAGVPTLYKALMDNKKVKQFDLSSVDLWLSGGSALPPATAKGWKELTGKDFVEGYGLSETSPLVIANPLNGKKKDGSIGIPIPLTDVKIANLEFPDQSCPIKVEGEICLKGPQVMKEYWGNPAETAKVMDKDGYFHTGDIGFVDDEGFVFIVDRIKDMINASGLKVFSRKVEEAILKHDAVAEVIVAGVPDDYRGETVKAYIVFKPGQKVEDADMTNFLKAHLAPYELPKKYEQRDSLPKTAIGKPDKKVIKAEEKARAEKKAAAKPAAAAPRP